MNETKLENLIGQCGSVGRLIQAAQSIIEGAERRPNSNLGTANLTEPEFMGLTEVLAQAAILNDYALDSADALRTGGDDAGQAAAERANGTAKPGGHVPGDTTR